MKKSDLENAIEDLEALRGVAARQDYNTSVEMNKRLIRVLPILEKELERMDKFNYEISSPVYVEITQEDCDDTNQTMQEYMNNYLENLADNEIDIIDFGINYISDSVKVGYIKYNRR